MFVLNTAAKKLTGRKSGVTLILNIHCHNVS